jgi:shikimate kinase
LNIFLIGSRGSGKTTVGALVGRRLKMPFVDLDDRVVQDAGMSIREIFAREGEEGFRRREREAVLQVKRLRNHVIALGGGTIMVSENLSSLRRVGKFVWLRAPAAVLWSRVSRDPHTIYNRPNLTAAGGLSEMEALLAQREPVYEDAATHVIDTVSMTVEQIADAIEMWYSAGDLHSH